MNGIKLQDIIARGLGTAARAIGVICDAYRPAGNSAPLASGNRFLQLSAAFNARDPQFRNAASPADATWYGVFDSAFLQAGDYLIERGGNRVWFIAALQSLLPATCVLTNRTLSVARPSTAGVAGVNTYGGGAGSVAVIARFPGNLLHGPGVRTNGPIPGDTRVSDAVALLPSIDGVFFARGDVVSDDMGRRFVVGGAEFNDFGWRLDLRQAAS